MFSETFLGKYVYIIKYRCENEQLYDSNIYSDNINIGIYSDGDIKKEEPTEV